MAICPYGLCLPREAAFVWPCVSMDSVFVWPYVHMDSVSREKLPLYGYMSIWTLPSAGSKFRMAFGTEFNAHFHFNVKPLNLQ